MSKGKERQVEPVYISIGCNRYSNVADVRKDGLVAYGAGKLVALWQSEDKHSRGVFQTLPGHRGTVTVVKFMHARNEPKSSAFMSADSAGQVILWQEEEEEEEATASFVPVATLNLGASIGSLASLQTHDGSHIITIGLSSCSLSIFVWNGQEASLMQDISLKRVMPMDLALTQLPNSEAILLALGGTDTKIQMFTRSSAGAEFAQTTSLPGHADWVRCLSFSTPFATDPPASASEDYRQGDILLASGSQDNYVRLWRLTTTNASVGSDGTSRNGGSGSSSTLDVLDTLDDIQDGEIAAKQYIIALPQEDTTFACTSESVLLGHDNWITGLHWQSGSTSSTPPALLSASADRSLIMWTQDPATSLWLTARRFGEIGGTNLGFFGALWGRDNTTVLAHGWGGSFHVWRCTNSTDSSVWQPVVSPSGHFGEVTSLCWEPSGDYLISVASDQTARLHAPWKREGAETWHELGRPQIHGYDMEDIAFLSRLRFISGSEEKIVRVFDAPAVFIASMASLGASKTLTSDNSRPNAATVPALGLSNKAVFGNQGQSELNGTATGTSDTLTFDALARPPTEEQLLTSTLWPETEKLYGHGYEINAIAASHNGNLVASACRATSAEHAGIRLHRTDNWAQLPYTLTGHTLTITRIVFSPDDRYILSVSRDRSWHLYEHNTEGKYELSARGSKAHARIIWDAAWSPDSRIFVTASRDKQVKVWTSSADRKWEVVATIYLSEAATAVSMTRLEASLVVAIGAESGFIHLHCASEDDLSTWTPLLTVIPSSGQEIDMAARLQRACSALSQRK